MLLGEVHCAIVYQTDAEMLKLPFIMIPDELQPLILYQLAYIQRDSNTIHPQTHKWVELFLSHIKKDYRYRIWS